MRLLSHHPIRSTVVAAGWRNQSIELGLGGASATVDLNPVVGATTPPWQMQTTNPTESRYERPSEATLGPSEGPCECGFRHTQTPLHASVQVSGARNTGVRDCFSAEISLFGLTTILLVLYWSDWPTDHP